MTDETAAALLTIIDRRMAKMEEAIKVLGAFMIASTMGRYPRLSKGTLWINQNEYSHADLQRLFGLPVDTDA
jgi:hypothetical protein